MVPSTGYLKYFKLYLYDEGFVVQMPEAAEPKKIPPFQPQNKLFHVLKESTRGGDMLGIETVGALNDYVTWQRQSKGTASGTGGNAGEEDCADRRADCRKSAEKVCLDRRSFFVRKDYIFQTAFHPARVSGLVPHPISVDDYFKNRVDTPLDAEGKPNYECLEALDVELLITI